MAGIGENICPARDYSSRSLCLSSTSSLSCVSGEEALYCGDTHYCARVNEVPTLLLRLTRTYKNYFRLKCHGFNLNLKTMMKLLNFLNTRSKNPLVQASMTEEQGTQTDDEAEESPRRGILRPTGLPCGE